MPHQGRNIIRATPQNTVGYPSPEFNKDSFDVAIWNYGYESIVEKAIECPCRGSNSGHPMPSCQNCNGIGWLFVNPTQTKSLITGINRETKYKSWSQELLGNISVTFRDIEQSSFMDRITIEDESSVFSEVKEVRTVGEEGSEEKFIFLSYPILSIEDVFIFKSDNLPLVRLFEGEYSLKNENSYVIKLTSEALDGSNNFVSVRYKHKIQYHILDMPYVIRSSEVTNRQGQRQKERLPRNYIARLAHYVVRPKLDGTGIQVNDYLV